MSNDDILVLAEEISREKGCVLTCTETAKHDVLPSLLKTLRMQHPYNTMVWVRDLLLMDCGEAEALILSWLQAKWTLIILDCLDVQALDLFNPVTNAILQFLDWRQLYGKECVVMIITESEGVVPANFTQPYRLMKHILSPAAKPNQPKTAITPSINPTEFQLNTVKAQKLIKRIKTNFHSVSGILITGASGVGKTYLSKKFVEQLQGFGAINVHCADLIHKEVGETEKKIEAIFQEGVKKAPTAIIFDNLDILFAKDDAARSSAMQRALAALLNCMDRYKCPPLRDDRYVLVIATASNIHSLSGELIRVGRLEEMIELTHLTKEQRREVICGSLSSHEQCDDLNTHIENLVNTSEGRSYGELLSLMRSLQMELLEKK